MKRRTLTTGALLAALLFAGDALAETRRLVMKNGDEHFGELTVFPDHVEIRTVAGKSLSFLRGDVAGYQDMSQKGDALTPIGESPPPRPERPAGDPGPTTEITDTASPGQPTVSVTTPETNAWYTRKPLWIGLTLLVVGLVGGLSLLSGGKPRPVTPERRRSGSSGEFKSGPSGCLIVLGVIAALAAAAGLYVWLNWRSWTADAARQTAEAMIRTSELTAADQGRVRNRVAQVIADFEAERIGGDELERMGRTFARGPLLVFTLARSLSQAIDADARLTADEKAGGRRALERWARGVADGRLPFESMELVFRPVTERGGNGRMQAKQQPTADDLRLMITAARTTADAAGIPDEPWKLDVAQAVIDLIDKAVGPAR
jgi:hypothetical protein